MKNKVLLFDNDSLTQLYSSTIGKLKIKGSVNVVTYPGSSKKTKLKILFECDSLLPNNISKRLFFHFDSESYNIDQLASLQNSIAFMLSKVSNKDKNKKIESLKDEIITSQTQYINLLNDLSNLGYKIVFFIENHEQSIIENNFKLQNLIDILFQNPQLDISLIWLTAKDLFNYDITLKERLTRWLNEEKVLEKDFPFTKQDQKNSITYYEKELGKKLNQKEKELILNISIKDASLIRHVLFKISNKELNPSDLSATNIKNTYELIGSDYLDKKYKSYVRMITFFELSNLKKGNLNECLFLNQLGLIENGEVVQPLFKFFISERLNIIFNDLDNLTGTERLVFLKLKSNINKVVTRDEIADILWGEKWATKYSDYMIDKVISNIRKKLQDSYNIEVVKGTGFILYSNN